MNIVKKNLVLFMGSSDSTSTSNKVNKTPKTARQELEELNLENAQSESLLKRIFGVKNKVITELQNSIDEYANGRPDGLGGYLEKGHTLGENTEKILFLIENEGKISLEILQNAIDDLKKSGKDQHRSVSKMNLIAALENAIEKLPLQTAKESSVLLSKLNLANKTLDRKSYDKNLEQLKENIKYLKANRLQLSNNKDNEKVLEKIDKVILKAEKLMFKEEMKKTKKNLKDEIKERKKEIKNYNKEKKLDSLKQKKQQKAAKILERRNSLDYKPKAGAKRVVLGIKHFAEKAEKKITSLAQAGEKKFTDLFAKKDKSEKLKLINDIKAYNKTELQTLEKTNTLGLKNINEFLLLVKNDRTLENDQQDELRKAFIESKGKVEDIKTDKLSLEAKEFLIEKMPDLKIIEGGNMKESIKKKSGIQLQ